MKNRYFPHRRWQTLFLLICMGCWIFIGGGCGHKEVSYPPLPTNEQKVPITLAIGPFDTTHLTYRGEPIDEGFGQILNEFIAGTLSKTKVFKKVFVLNTQELPHKNLNPESVRLAANAQGAEFLLVGQVQDLNVKTPEFFGEKEYEVQIVLTTELYHVLLAPK